MQTSSYHSGRRFVNVTRVWNLCHTSDRLICPVLQFWWRTRFQPSSNHCIFQMLLHVTSGPSQVSKIELKGYYFAS